MHEMGKITKVLHIDTTHNNITRFPMLAQKRTVRVTLDIECYDDLDLDDINWRQVLELEGSEEVYHTIQELDPFE